MTRVDRWGTRISWTLWSIVGLFVYTQILKGMLLRGLYQILPPTAAATAIGWTSTGVWLLAVLLLVRAWSRR